MQKKIWSGVFIVLLVSLNVLEAGPVRAGAASAAGVPASLGAAWFYMMSGDLLKRPLKQDEASVEKRGAAPQAVPVLEDYLNRALHAAELGRFV